MVDEERPLMQRPYVFAQTTSKQQEIERIKYELQVRKWPVFLIPQRRVLYVFSNDLGGRCL